MTTSYVIEGGPGTFRAPLTVEDLRNPKRKSGFDLVQLRRETGKFRATVNRGGTRDRSRPEYLGRARDTGEEAAQDAIAFLKGHATLRPLKLVKSESELDRVLADEVVHVPGPVRDVVPTDLTDKPDWVYWILLPTGRVKLGRSHRPRENRLSSYQTLFEEELKIVAVVKCPTRKDGEALERRLQTALAAFKVEGFGTELFTQDILPKFEVADLVDGEIVERA